MTIHFYEDYKTNPALASSIMVELAKLGIPQGVIAKAFNLTGAAVHYHLKMALPNHKQSLDIDKVREIGLYLVSRQLELKQAA